VAKQNSPLLVLLQFVDPNVLSWREDVPLPEGQTRATLLHSLANLADSSDFSIHEMQLILAKELIERGATFNAVSIPGGRTPFHNACNWSNVTNLDFVEFLLEAGADPNAQDHLGLTPLMCTTTLAPGAVKFLLNWPTTDVNITTRSGASFLARVRNAANYFSDKVARPDDFGTISKTNSCSSSGVKSHVCWWKGVLMIPGSQRWSRAPSGAILLQSRAPVR
jgi:hypothetical protein